MNKKLAKYLLGLVALVYLAGGGSAGARSPTAEAPFDIIVTNGHILDGTGSPWYSGDIGIRAGHIAAIGNLATAKARRRIDAAGKVVAPGFIDMLGQSDLSILVDPRLPSKIYQGITTEITGEGQSAAPLTDAMISADRENYQHFGVDPDWRTLRQYFARLERRGMGINLASYAAPHPCVASSSVTPMSNPPPRNWTG